MAARLGAAAGGGGAARGRPRLPAWTGSQRWRRGSAGRGWRPPADPVFRAILGCGGSQAMFFACNSAISLASTGLGEDPGRAGRDPACCIRRFRLAASALAAVARVSAYRPPGRAVHLSVTRLGGAKARPAVPAFALVAGLPWRPPGNAIFWGAWHPWPPGPSAGLLAYPDRKIKIYDGILRVTRALFIPPSQRHDYPDVGSGTGAVARWL